MAKADFTRAELIERIDFTEELARFRFRPEEPVAFAPGQYATVALEDGDKLIQRPYSIASAPYEPYLEFFVELVPQGAMTPRLWGLKAGDAVLIRRRVVGYFTRDEKSGLTRHLMAATVTGVAPFVSMARTQRADLRSGKAPAQQFAVLYGASRSREWGAYHAELSDLARDGWLAYVPTVSRPWEDPDWEGETGRVEDVVRKHADRLGFDHTNAVAYACGHPQMIESVRGVLGRARFSKERFKEEKYFSLTHPEAAKKRTVIDLYATERRWSLT